MTHRLFRLAALVAALLLPHAAQAAPPPMQAGMPFQFYEKVVESQAATAFLRADYAALEDMARRFRDSKSRTPIGSADLQQFYLAFDFPTTGDPAEDDRQLDRLERKALDWARAYPNSPTPHIVYAMLLQAHGCAVCASGYTPERFKVYQSYLDQARNYLLAHKDIASRDPQWYVEMLVLADDQNEEPTVWRPLLAEAMDRFPNYYAVYHAGTTLYADAGDADGLDNLIDDAVARTQAADGMELYARLYGYAGFARFDGGKTLFVASHAGWPRMLGSYIELTNKYPDPYLYEEMFFYACVAGDKVSARRALPHLLPVQRPDMEPADIAACSAWVTDKSNAPSPLFVPAAAPRADSMSRTNPMALTSDQAILATLAGVAVLIWITVRAIV